MQSRRHQQFRLGRFVIYSSVTALFLVIGSTARAQTPGAPTPAGHWTVTPSFLIGTGGDFNSTGAGFNLAAGYTWSPRVATEVAFGTLPSVDQGTLLNVNSHVWTFTGNALYYLAGRPFTPYLVAGIGFGHGSADIPPGLQGLGLRDSSTNFVVNFGAGVTRRLLDRVHVRGDARYVVGGDLVPSGLRLAVGVGFDLGGR